MSTGMGRFVRLGLATIFLFIGIAAQTQVQHSYGATDLPNVWTAPNDFTLGLYTGPLTFDQITSTPFPQPGTTVLCSNCSLSSNPCTVGSSQVIAVYLNGAWVCNTGGGSSGGGTITGVTAGTGLTGGGTSGTVPISLITTCSASQVLQWNGSAWVCATAGTGDVNKIPVAAQNIIQPCSGSPCQSTPFTMNNQNFVRNVTPSWNWSQSPSDNLTVPGAVTIHLAPCPLGIDTNSAANNYVYPVRIAGTGTPEQIVVTGGTCTAGVGSGTITGVTVNAHSAGYTVGSASSGIQEAWNDAWTSDTPHDASNSASPYVKLMSSTTYSVYATVYMRGRGGVLDGAGAFIACSTRDRCIYVGSPPTGIGYHKLFNLSMGSTLNIDGAQISSASASSGTITITTATTHPFVVGDQAAVEVHSQTTDSKFIATVLTTPSSTSYTVSLGSSTFSAGDTTFGFTGIENAAIEDASDHVIIDNLHLIQLFPSAATGAFSYGVVDDNDQQLQITGATNRSTAVIKTTANWPIGAFFYSRTDSGNAGIMYIHNTELTNINCYDSGNAGNGVSIDNTVCQANPVFGIRYFGSFVSGTMSNIYEAQGGITNPLYGITNAQMGMLLAGGQFGSKIVGTFPIAGAVPTFASGGSPTTQRNYFVVPHGSVYGANPPLFIGFAQPTSGAVSIPLQWPSIDLQEGLAHTSIGTLTWDVLVTVGSSAVPPFGTGNFAIATGISGSCNTAGICSFTDTQASASSYTVPSTTTFQTAFWFWPANLVNDANTPIQADFGSTALGTVSTLGPTGISFVAPTCSQGGTAPFRSPARMTCLGKTNANQWTDLFQPAGKTLNSKGDINFGPFASPPNDIITLVDSNPAKSAATAAVASGDASDTAIGADAAGGYYTRAATSISDYLNAIPNGTNWTRQLNASGETLTVPETNTTLTQGKPIGGGVGGLKTQIPEFHSVLFPGFTVDSMQALCNITPTLPCNVHIDAPLSSTPVTATNVVIGSTTQSVTMYLHGANIQCNTTAGACFSIGQNGNLVGYSPGNLSSGTLITTTIGFTGTAVITNSVTTGLQTSFNMSGLQIAPTNTSVITCGIVCINAVEGNTDIRNVNIQGIANTINWTFEDATSGSVADNNNVRLDNSKSYSGGKVNSIDYAVFGGAGGSGDGYVFTNLNGGDGCMGVFDGVTMCGVTMTEKVTTVNCGTNCNQVTLNGGSTFNFNTAHTGELFWVNGVAATICGPSYLGCSSLAVDPTSTVLYVTTVAGWPITTTGSAHWGCVGGNGCFIDLNGAAGRGSTLNNIHIDNSYIEGNAAQQPGSEYMAVQNVRNLEAPNLAWNVGPAVADCIGLYHTVANNQGRMHVAGRINGGHHCTEVFNNNITGNIYFLDSASQWDFDVTYAGDQSGPGTVFDSNITTSGVLGWTNGSGVNDVGISRESAGTLDIGNGAQGNTSGNVKMGALTVTSCSGCAIIGIGSSAFNVTIATTNTGTTATSMLGGAQTIPAGNLVATSPLNIDIGGIYTLPASYTGTVTIAAFVDGAQIATTGAFSVPSTAVTNGSWSVQCQLTTYTAGVSGTYAFGCPVQLLPTNTTTITLNGGSLAVSGTTAINTTIAHTFDLKWTWSTATGAPSVTGQWGTALVGGSGVNTFTDTLTNSPLNALPAASVAGNSVEATVSNNRVISQNGTLNGMYYMPGSQALRYHRWTTYAGGAATSSVLLNNDALAITCSTSSAIVPTSTASQMLACLTTVTNGNVSNVNGSAVYIPGAVNIWFNAYAAVGTLATTRWWLGFTNTTTANIGGTDTCSTFHCAAFTYSSTSAVSSTDFLCTTNAGGTGTQTQVDSGVAVVAGTPHVFDIREDTANSKWYFYIDGVSKCSSPITTTLPTATLRAGEFITNNGSASVAAQADFGWIETWTDH